MAREVPQYIRQTSSIQPFQEARISNGGAQAAEQMAGIFEQSARDLGAAAQDIEQKASRNFILQKRSQASRAMTDLTIQHQADPTGLRNSLDSFKESYLEGIDDQDLATELGAQYDLDADGQVERATFAQQKRVTDDLQKTTLSFLDDSQRQLNLDARGLFSPDPAVRTQSQKNITLSLGSLGKSMDQLGPDGQYIFTPEMRASGPSKMMDATLTNALIGRMETSKDPQADLQAMIDGTFKDDVPTVGKANPLDLLSPTAREGAIASMQDTIGSRSAVVKNSWDTFKAEIEYKLATDPLNVDVTAESEKWQATNSGILTDKDTVEITTDYYALAGKQAAAQKDYRAAAPYLQGTQKYDGSEDSEKAIKKGYEILKLQEKPLTERAAFLAKSGLVNPPTEFVNEMQATFQSAILTQNEAKAAEVAEAFDTIQANAPIFGNALDDKIEGGIMQMRDMLRMGAVGPDAFKDVQKIMSADKTLIDERKKEIKTIVENKGYRDSAASALDPGWLNAEPDTKAMVTSQAAADYRKIFEIKYLATGSEDLARKATEPLVKAMYGKTDLAPEGFMRMPPEKYYSIQGDGNTDWMREDLYAAVMSQGDQLTAPGTDIKAQLQVVADPLADPKTSKPEYLVVMSQEQGTPFDSLGVVWSPDQKARQTFLAQHKSGKLADKYYKRLGSEVSYDKQEKTRIPDYGLWIKDWYSNQKKSSTGGALDTLDINTIFDKGMIKRESGGEQFGGKGSVAGPNEPTTSPKGAIGAAQVMPGTGPEAAAAAGLPWDPVRWKRDKDYNVAIGRAYFKKQRDQFGDNTLAVAAYNAGPGLVQKLLDKHGDPRLNQISMAEFVKHLPGETRTYIDHVTKYANSQS